MAETSFGDQSKLIKEIDDLLRKLSIMTPDANSPVKVAQNEDLVDIRSTIDNDFANRSRLESSFKSEKKRSPPEHISPYL